MNVVAIIREKEEAKGSAIVEFLCPCLNLFGLPGRIRNGLELRELQGGAPGEPAIIVEIEITNDGTALSECIEDVREIVKLALKRAKISATVELFAADNDAAHLGVDTGSHTVA